MKQISGRLEYHVPAHFDEDRPAIAYSHVEFGSSIEDHELARRLPKARDEVNIHASSADFLDLARRRGAPSKIDDYLSSDEPQLSLHIVSFADATLVSIGWPHTLMDAMGRATLVHAWTCIINGEESKVPPFNGFNQDPLSTLGSKPPKDHFILGEKLLKGFQLLLFSFFYMFEVFWYWHSETHMISIPDAYLQSLKKSAMADLAAQRASSTVAMNGSTAPVIPPASFLSDSDILTSLIARLIVRQISSPSSTRPIVISNAYGLRASLASDLLPPEKAYVANAACAVYTILPARYFFPSQAPLSAVASAIRHTLQTQGTREQIDAWAYNVRSAEGRPLVAGTWNGRLLSYSNWSKAKFFDTDFSGAVIRSGLAPQHAVGVGQELLQKGDKKQEKRPRTERIGRPSYLHAWGIMTGYKVRHTVAIFGKDASENWWLSATLRKGSWAAVRREIEAMRA